MSSSESPSPDPEPSPGLLARGRAILSILITMVQSRLELAGTEIQEEYERLWPLILRVLICFVLMGYGLFFASLFVVAVFWDTYRLQALAAVSALYLLGGAVVAWNVYHLWGRRRRLFSSSLAEIEKDLNALRS